MFDKICEWMNHGKWPDVNHIQDVQCFIDAMCSTYNVSPIDVVFYPKWCMEQQDENAIGMAVYPNEHTGINQPREVWFCTEHFGFPVKTYAAKHDVGEGSQTEKISVIIHEFAHHMAHAAYGPSIWPHGFAFWKTNASIQIDHGFFCIPFFNIHVPVPPCIGSFVRNISGRGR